MTKEEELQAEGLVEMCEGVYLTKELLLDEVGLRNFSPSLADFLDEVREAALKKVEERKQD